MNQCTAMVKKGARCSRTGVTLISGYMFCTQHAKINQSKTPIDVNLLKNLAGENQVFLYQMHGYEMMGLKYSSLGGRLAVCPQKQTVYTWLLAANRLKNEGRLTKDLINHITCILLWRYM